jgi:hypothetical protein
MGGFPLLLFQDLVVAWTGVFAIVAVLTENNTPIPILIVC